MVEVVAPSVAWFTPRHSPVAGGPILDLPYSQRPPSAAQISVLSLSTSSSKRQDEPHASKTQYSRPQIKKIERFHTNT